MNGNIYYVMGFCCGILAVAIACFILNRRAKKAGKSVEFDERQQLARGKACRIALFTLVGYLMVAGILDSAWNIRFGDTFSLAVVGIILAVTVFACSCIMHDAYVSLGENIRQKLLIFAGCIVICTTVGFINGDKYGFFVQGSLQLGALPLLCAVMALCILIAMLIKTLRDRHAPVEE